LDRPSVHAKSLRTGSISTVLASVFFVATVLVQVGSSQQTPQSGDDAVMRRTVQYFISQGTQQYERGFYSEAEKTFQMAQGWAQYLEPVEQRKLESLRQKAAQAAAERKRVLGVRQTAEQLRTKGDVAAARAQLESIRDSEYLTDQERQEVADAIRGGGQPSLTGNGATAPAPGPQTAAPEAGRAAGTSGDSIPGLYYESVKAYQAGDFKAAKEGFAKVMSSGPLPAPMAETIHRYLADIARAEAGQRSALSAAVAGDATRVRPVTSATELAGTPRNAGEPNATASEQREAEKRHIEQLYMQSWELYSQGDLQGARRGFVEVANSGLLMLPEGKRPEDYIATINRLLAAQEPAPATPSPAAAVVPPSPAPAVTVPDFAPMQEPAVAPLAPGAAPVAEEGGSIEAINRRRNIIRSHTEAVVNDAINQAQRLVTQSDFAGATDRVESAQRVVNENQIYLGDELYQQYTQRLNETGAQIRAAQLEHDKQVTEQKRQEAAQEQVTLREQAEIDRQNRINELLGRAKAYWKQQQYEAALGQLEALLAIEPLHDEALTLKQNVEDMIYLRKQIELTRLSRKQEADIKMETKEARVPYADEITYPKDWRDMIERPTRQPDKPIGLDPANMQVYEQLEAVVDLSTLQPTTPVSEAFELLRRSVVPPLNIVVLWRDLEENALITTSTPINMDGSPNTRLGTGLENLLSALSNPVVGTQLGYVVNKGVITVGTLDSLPQKKMETRVYDIADLVGEPANYAGMGMMGMMGGMMGGMGGMGGMMGGMGGMGGYGGGMGGMGGMGGYGGGMGGMGGMGGYGGGMGGMGGYGGGMMGGMSGMGGMGGYGGGMGGMGGYGGGMMGGTGGMGGYGGGMMGGMGGMGMGGMGMMGGGYMSIMMAQNLRMLIEQSINPETWYDLYPDQPGAEGTIAVFPDQQPKKLAVYQTPEVHKQIEDLLDQLRKSLGHEVSIEARFLVVTENFLEDVGLDFDLSYNFGGKWGLVTVEQDSALLAGSAPTNVSGSLGLGTQGTPAATVAAGYGSILDDLQVSLLLRATEARTDSKALAAPKVTVLSGESAYFYLLDTISYALPPNQGNTTFGTLGGGVTQGTQTNNIGYMPVGSNLTITPTITKDKKYVLLNIMTQQQDLLRFRRHTVSQVVNPNTTNVNVQAGADVNLVQTYPVDVPEIETASVATRVSVPDRGTLLLGGHKLASEVEKEVGVPVLSKIPILGRLFTNRSSVRDEKILLILVKPTIILQEETEQQAIAAMEETVPAR
jgi:tetratricopeptide (TPR) repeat protein